MNKNITNKTKAEEIKTPPSDPVAFTRYSKRPQNTPQTPLVQPDDSSSRVQRSPAPKMNKVVGTDKPKKKKFKPANIANTNTPSYLKQPSEVPEVKVASLMRFMNWCKENNLDLHLSKLSLPTLASFRLGFYLSDNLTRDEKQRTERNLEQELEKTLERSELSQKDKSKKTKNRTAFQKMNDYFKGLYLGA